MHQLISSTEILQTSQGNYQHSNNSPTQQQRKLSKAGLISFDS